MRIRFLAPLLLPVLACNPERPGKATPETGVGTDLPDEYSLPDASTLPPELSDSTLPVADGGLPLVYQADRADAITAWADCAGMMSACLQATSGDFDTCVTGVPHCGTERPWEESSPCCATACVTAYDGLRAKGTAAFDAYVQVFALELSCMPGLGAR